MSFSTARLSGAPSARKGSGPPLAPVGTRWLNLPPALQPSLPVRQLFAMQAMIPQLRSSVCPGASSTTDFTPECFAAEGVEHKLLEPILGQNQQGAAGEGSGQEGGQILSITY